MITFSYLLSVLTKVQPLVIFVLMNQITEIIEFLGGPVKAGTALGVTYQAVKKWEKNRVPAEQVLSVVRAVSGRVSPHELRPDIYPDPSWMPVDVHCDA